MALVKTISTFLLINDLFLSLYTSYIIIYYQSHDFFSKRDSIMLSPFIMCVVAIMNYFSMLIFIGTEEAT